MLAIFGLYELVTYSKRIRFGERIMYGLVGTGIIATVISMMLLHPFQHLYFNFLVDRTTPEHLKREYYMGHWGTGGYTILQHLIEQYPSSFIHIDLNSDWYKSIRNNWMMLSKYDRKRIVSASNPDQNSDNFWFFDTSLFPTYARIIQPTLTYKYRIYNNTVFGLGKMKEKLTMFESITTGDAGVLVARSTFDIYQDGTTLTYIREPCTATDVWEKFKFFLHVVPSDDADLGADRIEYGTNNLDFHFAQHGAFWDGRCLAVITLPDYDIARIRTGQYISGKGRFWEVNFIPAKR